MLVGRTKVGKAVNWMGGIVSVEVGDRVFVGVGILVGNAVSVCATDVVTTFVNCSERAIQYSHSYGRPVYQAGRSGCYLFQEWLWRVCIQKNDILLAGYVGSQSFAQKYSPGF